jgi:hypothetical protein
MQFKPFIGPSYLLDSVNVDCQRSVNLFPQVHELGGGKNGEVASLIRTPGLELAVTVGTGPNRGLHTSSNNRSFAISGAEVYEVTAFGSTLLGTLDTLGGQCSMDDNGIDLLIVDGSRGYTFRFATNVFAKITDVDFPVAAHCCFIDQYLLVNDVNTRRFYLSGLSDAPDWDGLDFASKEGSPDNVVAIIADHRELFLIGDTTSEVWFDSGAVSFPFERNQGAFMEFGTCAPDAVKKLDNRIFMPAQDKNGRGVVMAIAGYRGDRISTYAVERAIRAGDLSNANAFTYQQDGHPFYCLNVPGLNSTWCYDVSTGMWHERDSWTSEGFTRNRAENHCMISGYHVVGDYQNGNLYKMKKDVYTENGQPLRWLRACPHLSKEMKRLFISEFRLDMQLGVGTSTVLDPQCSLRVSRDGGNTWSSEAWRSMGKQGDFKSRVMWNKLGTARDFVLEVSSSAATPATLISAFIETAVGAH